MEREQIYVTEVVSGDVLELPTVPGTGVILVREVTAAVGGTALTFDPPPGRGAGHTTNVLLPNDDAVVRRGTARPYLAAAQAYEAKIAERDALGRTDVPLDTPEHVSSKNEATRAKWATANSESAQLERELAEERANFTRLLDE